jgi:hypothetical protein
VPVGISMLASTEKSLDIHNPGYNPGGIAIQATKPRGKEVL